MLLCAAGCRPPPSQREQLPQVRAPVAWAAIRMTADPPRRLLLAGSGHYVSGRTAPRGFPAANTAGGTSPRRAASGRKADITLVRVRKVVVATDGRARSVKGYRGLKRSGETTTCAFIFAAGGPDRAPSLRQGQRISPFQRIATGLMIACTPPVMREWPRTNMNSQALSLTSCSVWVFSRM
jgi:hypothetical protein